MFNTTDNATAGCKKLLTDKSLEGLVEALGNECHDPIDFAYLQGFIGGIHFATVPKEAETYGMTEKDFAVNGCKNIKDVIIEDLMGNPSVGVTVIEIGRMAGNPDESNGDEASKSDGNPAEGDAE